jgi:siroheme synthase-like protein
MKHYPVYLNLKDRIVLVVGAGEIAMQKIQTLLESGAKIRVVAPEGITEMDTLAQGGKIEWRRRPYQPSDMEEVALAIAATDDESLQRRIAAEARARRIWVNVVDVPPLCDFIAPAVVRKGDIQIAISTGGASPAVAKMLRQKIEGLIGPEYEHLVQMLQRHRPDILKLPREKRRSLWESIISPSFLDQIKKGGIDRAEQHLKEKIYGKPVI